MPALIYAQIMIYMFSWITYSIHGSYDVYRLVYLNPTSQNHFIALIDVLWIIFFTIYLAGVVVMSSLVQREGKQTAILVHQAINLQRNPEVTDKVSFSQIIPTL